MQLCFDFGHALRMIDEKRQIIHSGNRFFNPDPQAGFTGLDNATYRQLIGMAATEPDTTKRKDLYTQIQDIILDESAAMTVSLYPQTGLATASVHGLNYDSRPALNYATAWLAT